MPVPTQPDKNYIRTEKAGGTAEEFGGKTDVI